MNGSQSRACQSAVVRTWAAERQAVEEGQKRCRSSLEHSRLRADSRAHWPGAGNALEASGRAHRVGGKHRAEFVEADISVNRHLHPGSEAAFDFPSVLRLVN